MVQTIQKKCRQLLRIVLLGCVLGAGPTQAQQGESGCGPLANAFGPHDYRFDRGHKLSIVETYHFTAPVEALIRGQSGSVVGVDLDYTLRAFPNHHRALLAMTKLAEKEKTTKPDGSRYTIDCWFDRAVRFRPDDTTARLIFASYLHKTNRTPEAIAQLENAAGQAKDNPFTQYNIGLVYVDMKAYDKALIQAHRALEMGFASTELRDILEKVGQWKEPSPPAPATSAAQ